MFLDQDKHKIVVIAVFIVAISALILSGIVWAVPGLQRSTLAPPSLFDPFLRSVRGIRSEILFNMKDKGTDKCRIEFFKTTDKDPVNSRLHPLLSHISFTELYRNSFNAFIDKIDDLNIQPEQFTGSIIVEVYYDADDIIINIIDNGKTVDLEANGQPERRETRPGQFEKGGGGVSAVSGDVEKLGGSLEYYPLKNGTKAQLRIPRQNVPSAFQIAENEYISIENKKEKQKWEGETVRTQTSNAQFVGLPGSRGKLDINITALKEFHKEAARKVARKIKELQEDPQKQVNIILDRGNTMRDILAGVIKRNDIDWKRIHVFQLHEFKGLPPSHEFSFAYFLKKNLFEHVPIPERNIHYINAVNPDDPDLGAYMEELNKLGGADIVLTSMGADGHLGFNVPPEHSAFDSRMREVRLSASLIDEFSEIYPDLDLSANPFGYTMGLADIFKARNIFLFANKTKKSGTVRKVLLGPVTKSVPASMFQRHPNVTVVLDSDAAAEYNEPLLNIPEEMHRTAFYYISVLIGQELYKPSTEYLANPLPGTRAEAMIKEIKRHEKKAELAISKTHQDVLLAGFELEELRYDENEDMYELPIYRGGVKKFYYKFCVKKESFDEGFDWEIPLGDGTNVYVKLEIIPGVDIMSKFKPEDTLGKVTPEAERVHAEEFVRSFDQLRTDETSREIKGIDLDIINEGLSSGVLEIVPGQDRGEFLTSKVGKQFSRLKKLYYGDDLDVVKDKRSDIWYMVKIGLDADKARVVRGIRSVLKYSKDAGGENWEDISEDFVVRSRRMSSYSETLPTVNSDDKVALIDLCYGPEEGTKYHPFGISLVFTALKNAGVPVTMTPSFKSNASMWATFEKQRDEYFDSLLDIIDEQGISVVACSVYSVSYCRTKRFLEKVRERFGNKVKVILGGPAVTSLVASDHKVYAGYGPWTYLVDENGRALADILVTGPGHETIVDVFTKPLDQIRGVEYCDGQRVVTTSLRDYPDWNFGGPIAVKDMFQEEPEGGIKRASILSTGSCPYSCPYCEGQKSLTLSLKELAVGKKMFRDLDLIMEDIWRYYEAGITEFFIEDPTFTAYLPHLEDFADAIEADDRLSPLIESGRINFVAFGRLDNFDTDSKASNRIRALKRIGVETLSIGVESVCHIKKRRGQEGFLSPEDYMNGVKAILRKLAENGISSRLLAMVGFPDETYSEARTTVGFINELVSQPDVYKAFSDLHCLHSYEIPLIDIDDAFIKSAGYDYPEDTLMDYPAGVLADNIEHGRARIIPGIYAEKHVFANLALIRDFEFDDEVGTQFYGRSCIMLREMLHLFRETYDVLNGRLAPGSPRAAFDEAAEVSSQTPDETTPQAEQLHTIELSGEISALPAPKKKAGVTFIALGTSWIEGYERGRYLQYNALNPLVSSLANFCEEQGIPFILGDDAKIANEVRRLKDADGEARGIVLAGEETINSLNLENDENVFLAGVNNENLTIDSYMPIMEMLTLLLRLLDADSIDEESIKRDHERLGVRFDPHKKRYIYFTPDAIVPKDYKTLERIYRFQRFA